MKKSLLLLIAILIFACKGEPEVKEVSEMERDTIKEENSLTSDLLGENRVEFTREEANRLAELPLNCINTEYPNKLNQTLENKEAIGEPSELHPAFYGCFDWHSSVHAHWSMVSLLKQFPDLEKAETIREKLKESLSEENIQGEVAYFNREQSDSFERTYGWAWLLKLAEEIETWNDPLAKELKENLDPLTNLIVNKYLEFLPKLNYPIRVGEHANTAFGLSFAYDYAVATENTEFKQLISNRARDFYLKDDNCPITWEPGGFDFLSPCLEEVNIMRRVLPKNAFEMWLEDFLPQLKSEDFEMEVGEVSDRTDGKLVHLDGLNFSRAWVFYGLINQYPDKFSHLQEIADRHVAYSFPNLVGDSYEGGHWLGSFAIYALQESKGM
ncbi:MULTISPECIES: DUF2891 domain-containing protein [Salegentibacter]|jgi:hypothetical protein|uniref:DUF2891 domain-containing protein n=1 Tax=Salegentibacter agarivorans TaxID=345907 RepID=A0A1I2JZC5_9FLAO|nr:MULTISPECIES: DUF2891 domain-containing protein [Salegentibacter]APS39217.1 hypothetical protein AO058_10190 [Salegentibacter sp. T436]SFF59378.1 Protein of unknown function [Salegentibacter agarivorans]